MRKFIYLFLFCIFFFHMLYAQKLSEFSKGIGIEFLTGHNSFDWDLKVYNLSRNESYVTANGKMFYRFQAINGFSLEPFISYTQFGGKSPKQLNGYQDWLELSSLDLGGFILYNTGLFNIDLGIGFKAKYHLNAKWHQFGNIDDNPETPKNWTKEDASDVFTKTSANAGFRIATSYDRYRIGIEYWLGLTDLKNPDYFANDETGTITESHYRFAFGILL